MIESNEINNLIKRFNENRLAHAFLVESNDYDNCLKDILNLVKLINCPFNYNENCDSSDCNLCTLIDSNNLPSLYIVNTDDMNIKKDVVEELLDKFSSKPVYSKYNIYIFVGAEKLSGKSANMLLKFVEEPSDDIVGFFITNNIENVMLTIRSRCQLLYCNYGLKDEYIDDEMLDQVKIYLNNIYKNPDDIVYNREVINWYKDRSEWNDFFKKMLYYLNECYTNKRKDKTDVVKSISNDNIIKIIVFIKEIIEYIGNNVNIDLILDKFVIEMRKYYE